MKYTKIFFIVLVSFLIFNTNVFAYDSTEIEKFPLTSNLTNIGTGSISLSTTGTITHNTTYGMKFSPANNSITTTPNFLYTDFDLSFQFRPITNFTNGHLFNLNFNGVSRYIHYCHTNKSIRIYPFNYSTSCTSSNLIDTSPFIPVLDTDYIFSVERINNEFKYYIDNTLLYTETLNNDFLNFRIGTVASLGTINMYIKDLQLGTPITIDSFSQSDIDIYEIQFNDFYENYFVNDINYDSYFIYPIVPYGGEKRYQILLYQYNINEYKLSGEYYDNDPFGNDNNNYTTWLNNLVGYATYNIQMYELQNNIWVKILDNISGGSPQVFGPQVFGSNNDIDFLPENNTFNRYNYIRSIYKSTQNIELLNMFSGGVLSHVDTMPLQYKGMTVNLGYNLFPATDTSCQLPNKTNPISVFTEFTTPLNSIGFIINDLRDIQKDFNVFLDINTESSFISRMPIAYYYDYENNVKTSSLGNLGVATYNQVNDCITTYNTYLPYLVKNDKLNNYFYYIEYDKVIPMLPDTILDFYIDNNLVLNVDYEIIWVYENTTINFTNPNTNLSDSIYGGTSITPRIEKELSFMEFLQIQMANMRNYFSQMTSLSSFLNYFIASMPPIFSVMLAISFVFIVIKFIRGVFF